LRRRFFAGRRIGETLLAGFVLLWTAVLCYLHGALDRPDDVAKNLLPQAHSSPPVAMVHVLPAKSHVMRDKATLPPFSSFARHYARPSKRYQVDATDLWEQDPDDATHRFPEWMKDYFRWHKENREQMRTSSFPPGIVEPPRYLILTCPHASRKCGGLVDRLAPLAFLVLVASRTHRMLWIHWGRPAPLEEFLQPPRHGVDWRWPYDPHSRTVNEGVLATSLESLLAATEDNQTAVRCRFQAPDRGATFYHAHQEATTDPTLAQVTRSLWNLFFTPVPAVAQRISDGLQQHSLVPGHYIAMHVRALYAVKDQDPYLVRYWTYNAVNCTSQLVEPNRGDAATTLFVAADATYASKLAQNYGAKYGWTVVHSTTTSEPLHLDKAAHWQDRPSSDYYDAFVDLYLLALSRCVTFGMGNYGRFASWLSVEPSCALQHHNATGMHECNMAPAPTRPVPRPRLEGAIFRPPMANAK
jgi:hypothetical protein